MYMAYTTNPKLPKLRMDAVRLVRSGWSIRQAARYYGYQPSTVMRWVHRAEMDYLDARRVIPTSSSRPRHHPHELSDEIVEQILECRHRTSRGAEFIHFMLTREGVDVSLSSVKRTLKRHNLTKYSQWKKWHTYSPRPLPELPGLLVEADTIHDGQPGQQLYIYTLLDVCSRWAFAIPARRIGASQSVNFLRTAQTQAPFSLTTIQTDHGSEFSKWFTEKLAEQDVLHRHSRVRTPNDNAHLERFNRTIQEECIQRLPRKLEVWKREIPEYLRYYNTERPHMGIDWLTPVQKLEQVLRSY
jgi:transposase InsO family protein